MSGVTDAPETLECIQEREDCLNRVRELICNNRSKEYGDFRDNYEKTAQLMSAITGKNISIGEVLLMLVGMKLARETTKHKQDNIDDAIGYLALYSELMKNNTTDEFSIKEM